MNATTMAGYRKMIDAVRDAAGDADVLLRQHEKNHADLAGIDDVDCRKVLAKSGDLAAMAVSRLANTVRTHGVAKVQPTTDDVPTPAAALANFQKKMGTTTAKRVL